MDRSCPLADVLELAELMLRLHGREGIDAILDQLEDGEITGREAVG
jgi:hypothetical protein